MIVTLACPFYTFCAFQPGALLWESEVINSKVRHVDKDKTLIYCQPCGPRDILIF